jgi:hypothetical protein
MDSNTEHNNTTQRWLLAAGWESNKNGARRDIEYFIACGALTSNK